MAKEWDQDCFIAVVFRSTHHAMSYKERFNPPMLICQPAKTAQ